MNDQEKSVLLAKAMGWELHIEPFGPGPDNLLYIISPDEGKAIRSFYYEDNMALAWRVKQWAHSEDDRCMVTTFSSWYDFHNLRLSRLDGAEAMREWLDKILELAIEAGIVEKADD